MTPKKEQTGWNGTPWLFGAIVAFVVLESAREGTYALLIIAVGMVGMWIGGRAVR